jgi:hypothetical protein
MAHASRFWLFAMVTALAVVIAGLTLPQNEAVATERPVDVAPILPSEPSTIVGPKVPSGEFLLPQEPVEASAAAEDPATTEVETGVDRNGLTLESRAEYENVYVDGEGSQVVQLSPTPLNAKDDDGEWAEIKAEFSNSDEGWGVEVTAGAPHFWAPTEAVSNRRSGSGMTGRRLRRVASRRMRIWSSR